MQTLQNTLNQVFKILKKYVNDYYCAYYFV